MTKTPGVLNAGQLDHFHTEGYVVVDDLLTEPEVRSFVEHLAEVSTGTYGLHGHLNDPQYRFLATHPRVAGAAAQPPGSVRCVCYRSTSIASWTSCRYSQLFSRT